MDKLTPIEIDEPDTQIKILNFSLDNAERLRPWLSRRFDAYNAADGLHVQISDTPYILRRHKKALQGIYESESKLAEDIRDRVRASHTKKCPYCGTNVQPHTIEHILPQSRWCEFSLYSRNLLPACESCNNRKNAKHWCRGSGIREFLNPYCDDFLGSKFFNVIIKPDIIHGFNRPYIEIIFLSSLTRRDVTIAKKHFKNLDLKNRLSVHVASRLETLRQSYLPEVQSGTLTPAQFISDLRRQIRGEEITNGENAWNSVTLRAVIESPDLVDFIIRTPLVTPLPR